MTANRSLGGLPASNARALWGPRHRSIVRLGWTQLAVVCGVRAAVVTVVGIAFERDLSEQYARRFAIRPFEAAYGFETGIILVRPPSGAAFEEWGILKVSSTGDFARLGVREMVTSRLNAMVVRHKRFPTRSPPRLPDRLPHLR